MVFRRRRVEPATAADPLAVVDPAAVPATYAAPVADALAARRQFGGLVAGVAPGPLRERLEDLGHRVDAGVLAVWGTAQHAAELERVVATLDPARAADALKRARRDGAPPDVQEPLAARFASIQRLLNTLDTVRDQLPVLEARLASAVARTTELTLTSTLSTTPAELDGLGRELDGLARELTALGMAADDLA